MAVGRRADAQEDLAELGGLVHAAATQAALHQ
jgi:hypothetical protein